ncbi:hypothetical protein EKO27_g3151 [Xylaria grammica]|uniref:Uncharacterized protein n=1 Tax=Xylaria grammica TaxID=363999 RepID=A0A439DC30_9PEZI|nr:hypothetical protein EKO27_g3151 [Xylaria grammica]
MELTPIRVRGKRRTPGEELLVAPPPKRFHKDLSRKKQVRVRRLKASNIEKSIPLEVLERIFWLSENVNFPRASPRLGRLLSGSSTLRETFLSAFGPTWEVWFGCVHGQNADFPVVHSYAGWEEDVERFGGNPRFQSDLLAYSWTTIDMILDCWDIWVRRHARKLQFDRLSLWGDPIVPISYTGSDATVGISNIREARCYFYHDYHAFRNVEQQSSYTEGLEYRAERNPSTWIEVHKSIEIPDDLITGPWDEYSLQKFFWLVQAGAHLSSGQTWEVTRQGFHNAISDRHAPNLTAIRLLHILGAFHSWPRHVRKEEFHKVDSVMPTLNRDKDSALHAKYTWVESLLIMNVG